MIEELIVETRKRLAATIDHDLWLLIQPGEDGDMWETRTQSMRVIWSIAEELDLRVWMHVSVSRPLLLPSYGDMKRVKRMFIGAERMAYSVWAPEAEHVNIHARALHLWSPLTDGLPLPDFTRGRGTI